MLEQVDRAAAGGGEHVGERRELLLGSLNTLAGNGVRKTAVFASKTSPAPELEEPAVPVALRRGYLEQSDGLPLGDELLELLARAVPVDEKDQARAEMGEEPESA